MAGLKSLLKPGEAVALWAISADSSEQSKQFARELSGLNFPLLADRGHLVIDAYGLPDPRYLMQRRVVPYPATYVIDKSGKVAWARIDKDYTQRPQESELRAALNALK